MKAHKMSVTIPEDHQVEIRLPEDFPAGPAEVIVLADSSGGKELGEAQRDMLRALERLRTVQRTPEEERILDEFEEFRRQHPIDFSSLTEEER
ncbi:MAG TPA: hypothetical protein VGG03_04110 [Thermoanaerobaculia bacterium]|jgi:hypothetical protein